MWARPKAQISLAVVPHLRLAPQGSPDRDAVAVMALSLYFFQDPGRGG
ncbi:MAG: hypothetical protein ACI8U3_000349 [Brevundimonas sp.]|jgi:hypothetical protein